MSTTTPPPCPASALVTRLTPMAHVVSVERSVAFYELLGLRVGHTLSGHDGKLRWAMMLADRPEIMFARASGPVVPEQQAVLFYLYTNDVAALRAHLLAAGLRDAGAFCGGPMPGMGQGAVSTITYPDYMAKGELRVEDPDGYCLLVGQLE